MTQNDAGTHAEGGIWATLFGLLMWDIIFMDVPDVFQTAFQTAPLDLGTVVFYPSRKDAIEARLSEVREGQGPALLQSCWQEHYGEWCRGVNWDRHGTLRLCASKCVCVGGWVGGWGYSAVRWLLRHAHKYDTLCTFYGILRCLQWCWCILQPMPEACQVFCGPDIQQLFLSIRTFDFIVRLSQGRREEC